MASDNRRVDVGFQGGQILSLRLGAAAYDKLAKKLDGSGWHTIETEEQDVLVDLDQVVYVRRESDAKSVGF